MATPRNLLSLIPAIYVLTIAAASAFDGTNSNIGNTREVAQPPVSELAGGWHLVRTHNPYGGTDAVSIMHTADTSRSDLDLAGLMIRCRKGGTEVAVVLLRPYPLRARPHVVFGTTKNETRFEATVAPPGTAVVIPLDAASLVTGPWGEFNELSIRIDDGQSTIRGVVALANLRPAIEELNASCLAQ